MNRFLKRFLALFGGNPWEFGTCGQGGRFSRRNVLNGEVQFIMWPKGTDNRFKDIWLRYDTSWYPTWELGSVPSYDYGTIAWQGSTLARKHKQSGVVEYVLDYNREWQPTTPDIAAIFKPGFK